jgi:ComF family protein
VISKILNIFFRIVQEAVFPPKCLVCAAFFRTADQGRQRIPIGATENARPAALEDQAQISLANCLCPHCLTELVTVDSPLCPCCGIPFKSRQGQDHYCGDCIATGKKFGIARAPLVYDKVISEVIHSFKYRGKIQLAEPLSELLLTAFRFFWDIEDIDIILPVPLHPARLRQRGFNQAYLLIRNWPSLAARHPGGDARFRVEREVLIRTLPTLPQSALGRDQRAVNIKNAFELNHRQRVHGKKILLIDDVYTTGATVNECGRLLLDHGAQQVDVLTLARAV